MKTSDKFMWFGIGFLALILLGWYKIDQWYKHDHGDPEAGMDDPPSQW